MVDKSEFNIDHPSTQYIHGSQIGNEYNSTFGFKISNYDFFNYDILLLKVYPPRNLFDFNIKYKYVYEKSYETPKKKDETWVYVVIAIGAFFCIFSLATTTRVCYKKKANSNLIVDNIDVNANLMPQENQETQEIQEIHETQETQILQEENK